jgi:3-dehydroquinate synthase
MRSLEVNVARVESRSPLWVGRELLEKLTTLIPIDRYSSVVVVADRGAPRATARIQTALQLPPSNILTVEGGEGQKSIEGLVDLWNFFVERKLDRKSLIFTVGGGATSDLVGFAAATFMRGVAFIHVPTTLLAQVDASIGGKSGINFKGVKNLIGSISQPCGIIIDIDTLSTLPERELRSGFAEVVKHGLIADTNYFTEVTAQNCTLWSPEQLVSIVFRSCEIKKQVVEADEYEQGPRKTLNFGHSIGHAIESYTLENGPHLTHGEAISVGMAGESFISYKLGKLSQADLSAIERGLENAGLPTRLPLPISPDKLRELITKDKKNVSGRVKWTLLNAIGVAVFDVEVPEELIHEALQRIQPGGPCT